MNVYKQHPLSAAFPAMGSLEFAELKLDIKNHGLRCPIVIFERMVLDGWHRYQACDSLGIYPATTDFDEDDDPVAFVRSQNYHRRHMSAGQKAVAEVELGKWARVGHQPNSAPGAELEEADPQAVTRTVAEMAKAADVGTRTIEQAKVVVEAGLADAVKAGEVSVKRAAEVAKLPEPERQAAIHAPRPKPEPRPRPERDASGEPEGRVLVTIKERALLPKLQAQVIELEAQVAERESEIKELAKLLQDTEEENKSFGRVIEADDQVKAAMAEAKRYRELSRVVEERNRGMQANAHALAKDAKRWMNKFLRLERLHKGEVAALEPEPDDDDPGPSDAGAGPLFTEPEPFVA